MLPKKIAATLKALNINGVVDGYFTLIPGASIKDRVKGICRAAFTGWNKNGKPVCVLVKARSDSGWKLKERKRP